MNIVNSGRRFQIYGEDLRTFKNLPVGSYEVAFDMMQGFFLVSRPDLVANEEKIYGNHQRNVDKVMKSFSISDRNLGLILSGQKGIGKSLFARLLAQEAIKRDMPVITVGINAPGISGFLASIEQECLIIFDEFEKVFGRESHDDDDGDTHSSSQEGLLSLFDGLDNGKKLFCITCNNPNELSGFFINRPGRFHYHFTLGAPSEQEVKDYMTDKLAKEYHGEIDKIVKFAQTTHVTYDYLRALAFELNQGYTFSEALRDLNICNYDNVYFDIIAVSDTGEIYKAYSRRIDIYDVDGGMDSFRLNDPTFEDAKCLSIRFFVKDIELKNGTLSVDPNKAIVQFCYDHLGKDRVIPKITEIKIVKQEISYLDKYDV